MNAIRTWFGEINAAWNRFWYTAVAPHTLAMIRILAGAMLLYTHLVWSKDLLAFLGPHGWINNATSQLMHEGSFAWSFWWYIESPILIWILHLAALCVFAMLTLGLYSRVVSILAFFIALSYCHRLEGALFGLDQVNAMLAMYLMIGPCGAVYSLDRWRARRRAGGELPPLQPTISANVSIRLIQCHMCILYLFAGVSKMRGDTWWDGSALWFGIANLEYQSLDVTWLGRSPTLLSLITHATVFWETFYCVLVWPRLTRPLFLGLAVFVHAGIAMCLGMITFGTAMLIGNLAFVSPRAIEGIVCAVRRRLSSAKDGSLGSSRELPGTSH